MQQRNRWMVVALVIAGLQLVACAQAPARASKVEPARVEPIAGSELKRVVLADSAAKRLGIQTTPVREEQVARKRTVGGKVLDAAGGARGAVGVRVPLTESDRDMVDRAQPALVRPIARGEGRAVAALPIAGGDARPQPGSTTVALNYVVDSAEHGLVWGQAVLIELPLLGGGAWRPVIPYAAVIYDVKGATWAYTNPEPLVFVRHPISIDYIDGERVVLSEGPPLGSAVVTAGAAELFGTETGVGK